MPKIAALFVQKNGVYYDLPDVDPWPDSRDARRYRGRHPVIAHPPCARWCRLAYFVQARHPEKAVGTDDGCFASALAAVRRCGGVLEHPAFSIAWPTFGLTQPPPVGWLRGLDGGWVCSVSQAAYGHQAAKETWLYYVGAVAPPPLDWRRLEPVARISDLANHGNAHGLKILRRRKASATPIAFRDLLLSLARLSRASTRRGAVPDASPAAASPLPLKPNRPEVPNHAPVPVEHP